MKIYIDGTFYDKDEAKVSVFDHGLLYGDGVFEGIRAYNGRIFRLKEHLNRLEASAQAVYLDLPQPLKKIEEAVIEAVRQNRLRDAYIRLVVTRGIGDLGLDMRKCRDNASLIIIADRIELYPQAYYDKGLDLIISTIRQRGADQLPAQIKSLNYLANILARSEATRSGAHEAILLNREGYVTECTGDNIFFVRDGRVYTPPVSSGILEGITRQAIIEICRDDLNNPVVEALFTPAELFRAQEIFLSGTGAEVIGAVKIDGHQIGNGQPGPLTRKIVSLFRAYAGASGVPVYGDERSR